MSKYYLMVSFEAEPPTPVTPWSMSGILQQLPSDLEHEWSGVTNAKAIDVTYLQDDILTDLNSEGVIRSGNVQAMFDIEYDENNGEYFVAGEATREFLEKQRNLALYLFGMAVDERFTSLEEIAASDIYGQEYVDNYMADANDILRANTHLLGLQTVEAMGLQKVERP